MLQHGEQQTDCDSSKMFETFRVTKWAGSIVLPARQILPTLQMLLLEKYSEYLHKINNFSKSFQSIMKIIRVVFL